MTTGSKATMTQAQPQTSSQSLLDILLKEADMTPDDIEGLPLDTAVTAAGLKWETGKAKPNDPGMMIFLIFSGDHGDDGGDHLPGDARIYAFPTQPDMPYVRYTANRSQTVGYRFTSMNGVVFVRQIAFELQRLAVAEGERFDCPGDDGECGAVLRKNAKGCEECGWDPNDDEEDPEETTPTEVKPATPSTTTAVS